MKYQNLTEYIQHAARKEVINGWEVIKTIHGVEREAERLNSEFPGGFQDFIKKIIAKVDSFKNARSGEFMYKSRKYNQAIIINLDVEKKQIRIISMLPKGKDIAKAGTVKVLIEGVEYEVVELYDTDYEVALEEAFNEINDGEMTFEDFMGNRPIH